LCRGRRHDLGHHRAQSHTGEQCHHRLAHHRIASLPVASNHSAGSWGLPDRLIST
jgi:hypothetical protein